jgi:hypothetical protein
VRHSGVDGSPGEDVPASVLVGASDDGDGADDRATLRALVRRAKRGMTEPTHTVVVRAEATDIEVERLMGGRPGSSVA